MFERPANRIYRKSQMGLWFGRAACDWEKAFRAEEILYGRKLYKEGAIRTVELSENEAIICAKLPDASEPYCVLDFEGDRYVRRGSSDNFQNAALSVAGSPTREGRRKTANPKSNQNPIASIRN